MDELYFAYGSNLNLAQMAVLCPQAQLVGKAVLEGYELAFRRGLLTILPTKDGKVEGVAWKINARDESALDRYEGYPRLYRKELLTVQTEEGQQRVMGYIMNAPYRDKPQFPTAGYAALVLQGYEKNGISQEELMKAAGRTFLEIAGAEQQKHRGERRNER